MSEQASNSDFFALASSRSVVATALRISALVGTLLVAINHGTELLAGEITLDRFLRIALTYLVPYCVSTYSSVKAIQSRERD